ncbi:MAG: AraC family transcriptional regulator [Saprospiraceae bacterium]|nr:AraC family transcriptional regulator [Saprospiraceae bacterium]
MDAPSFDTWTSLFLIVAAQGLFFSFLFGYRTWQKPSSFGWLIALLCLFSISIIEYVLYWTRYQIYLPHSMGISATFPFLYGPFLFFYFNEVFHPDQKINRKWLHFLPFIIGTLLYSPMYFASTATKIDWMLGTPTSYNWQWIPFVQIAQLIAYGIIFFVKFNKIACQNPAIQQWYWYLNLFFSGFTLCFTSYYVLINFSWFNSEWDYAIAGCMTIFIYLVAWFGYAQPSVFNGFTLEQSLRGSKYKNSGLTEIAAQQLQDRLSHLMQQSKLYRDSELRLEKLADILHTSRHNLSQVINERFGQSFFDYLNTLRIEEAKELLASTTKQDMTIIEIAYQVGFNNKVSFNSMFKKRTNFTPSQYRDLHLSVNSKENATNQRVGLHN